MGDTNDSKRDVDMRPLLPNQKASYLGQSCKCLYFPLTFSLSVPCDLAFNALHQCMVSLHPDKRDPYVSCCSPNNCRIMIDANTSAPYIAFFTLSHTITTGKSDQKAPCSSSTTSSRPRVVLTLQWLLLAEDETSAGRSYHLNVFHCLTGLVYMFFALTRLLRMRGAVFNFCVN